MHNNFLKGMNYAGFHPDVFAGQGSDEAIDHLAATGVNWVAVNVFWYQNDGRATAIGPHESKTATDASLAHLIGRLRSHGQSILLKPMVDARDHTWRGQFRPVSWEAWFESYERLLLHYAEVAAEHQLEMLCVGCEFPMHKVDQNLWRDLIHKVRSVYSGPITYAANHNKKSGYQRVAFWDELDYVGIDAYFSVSGKRKNTMERMQRGWNRCIRKIENWRRQTGQDKPVLFTELGATSVTGGARKPWAYDQQSEPNWEEQARYYEAFFRACEECDWLRGAFWWWWDNPSTGDYLHFENSGHPTSYTPRGKDAERVIKAFWA